MKKIVTLALMLALASGVALSAQNYDVYNKLGSEGLFMTNNNSSGFGGLYNTVSGLIHYSMFSVQAQYRLSLEDQVNFKNYSLNGTMEKANVWFRPVKGLEVAVGNKFYQTLPGAFLQVYDDYTLNGWYGEKYVGATFTYAPVTAGLNIPKMTLGDNFSMKINFGLNVAIAKNFNIGAAYKMEKESIGVFFNYGGVKNFYLGGGYTFNGESLVSDILKKSFDDAHVFAFTLLYSPAKFSFGADAELSITNKKGTPLYAGAMFAMNLTKAVAFKVDAKYFASFGDAGSDNNPYSLTVHPRVIFVTGRHQLIGGAKLAFNDSTGSSNSKTDFTFAIPVSWKYTFK
ncbi:hypothetical protein [Treponema brennaborense]|uniref:Major outer membrane protein n=1 Tax=Treponema brennaborense (strain DSM 12168 / CIP 105900 / DD5/3) TaxID=906968 RepID=F4LM89_TREBD|nr:hypothetical protein [Treponema brennaborense]AEE17755.1 hypothetical protein Trebr_2346 [Treponema brennaborense DSM 12168]